jgi:hypothetical protein
MSALWLKNQIDIVRQFVLSRFFFAEEALLA